MSFSSEWQGVKDAWNDSKSPASPGARFGLLFDPTRYVADAFGKGDEYRSAITKSGDWMNERLSGALGTSDRGGWAANKPASTLGLLAAGYFTGGGMLGGGSSSGAGSGSGGLGIFSNGGASGMSGVGGGNAGALAAGNGIGGGSGIGSATSGGGFLGSLQQNPQQYLQMMQGMGGGQQQQQQQEPRPLQPVVIKGRVFWI